MFKKWFNFQNLNSDIKKAFDTVKHKFIGDKTAICLKLYCKDWKWNWRVSFDCLISVQHLLEYQRMGLS